MWNWAQALGKAGMALLGLGLLVPGGTHGRRCDGVGFGGLEEQAAEVASVCCSVGRPHKSRRGLGHVARRPQVTGLEGCSRGNGEDGRNQGSISK